MTNTTLCYVEKDGRYLMLYRNKKPHDPNAGKWVGIGGHMEEGESPEDCLKREAYEETGLVLEQMEPRGLLPLYRTGMKRNICICLRAMRFPVRCTPARKALCSGFPSPTCPSCPCGKGTSFFFPFWP